MGGLTTRQLASKQLRNPKQQGDQLPPGEMLQNRYQIMGTLGVGGFSSVYQARDMRFPTVTKLCAVKEMVNMAADPQMRDLTISVFEREANILATLDHPSIPIVYDYFTQGDRSYLVMEFIRGKDLEALVSEQKGIFKEDRVLDWALQLSAVLTYLHGQKPQPVVFRDLKPSNIILDPNNRIHLIDFGIAKAFKGGDRGTTIGTEGYSPPEQYRGEAGPPGDVYAFGATLHHLLTLKDPRLEPPFSFSERPIYAFNQDVSPAFADVVMRCLAYDTEDRYPDGMSLQSVLEMLAARPTSERMVVIQDGAGPELNGATAPAKSSPAPVETAPEVDDEDTKEAGVITPIWSFTAEDEIRSTPAVANGVVYVGTYDNNLYALDAQNGEFVWKFPATDGLGASPCAYGDMVFVGSSDNYLYAVQAKNGRMAWSCETGGAIYSSPQVDFDHVFFGSDDGHVYAVNAPSGRVAWKVEAHSPVRSTPLVGSEAIYFGTEGGYVFCIDLTGKMKWQFQARRAVTSSPALADDLIVIGSLDATVYAIDAGTGWAVWRFRTRRSIVSSPIIHNGVVYIGSSDGNLYALDLDSGRKLWSFETEGQVPGRPAIFENAVYFGSTDGHIYSVGLKRGRLRWRFDTQSQVIGSPTIANGIVYVGATNHTIYALPL